MKKEELLRTFLHLLSHQPPSLFFSLTLLEIRLAIFEYLAILQYATISKWQNVCDGRVCATESDLVTKKEKLPRTFIYLFFDAL